MAAVPLAGQAHYAPLLAETKLTLGRVYHRGQRTKDAEAAFQEAELVAEEIGYDRVRAEAWVGTTKLVLDENSRPISDAQVIVGTRLVADGKYLDASWGGRLEATTGYRQTVSDGTGHFELVGDLDQSLVLAAEHAEAGRSAHILLPQGQLAEQHGWRCRWRR